MIPQTSSESRGILWKTGILRAQPRPLESEADLADWLRPLLSSTSRFRCCHVTFSSVSWSEAQRRHLGGLRVSNHHFPQRGAKFALFSSLSNLIPGVLFRPPCACIFHKPTQISTSAVPEPVTGTNVLVSRVYRSQQSVNSLETDMTLGKSCDRSVLKFLHLWFRDDEEYLPPVFLGGLGVVSWGVNNNIQPLVGTL